MATTGKPITKLKPNYDGILRRPKFDIRFLTEKSEFHIVHDTGISLTNRYMTESVVSITTTNSMEDDSSAFSFVLAGFMEWDKLINSNDMIILKINPSEIDTDYRTNKKVKDDMVMIGLVSEVRIEAEYSDDSRLYRITGQSFAKAFIQFELNTIRQVVVPMTSGWLLNTIEEPSNVATQLQGKTVAESVKILYDRFIQYMDYDFRYITGSGGDTERKAHNTLLRNRIVPNFSSWKNDEYLMDPLPFLNFEGSFNQMLNEVVTRPFCEMFFEVHSSEEGNEKAEFVVRRTPFDKKDWDNLPVHWIYSRDVIAEDMAQSDLDAYAVFNVFPENSYLQSTSGMVRPKYSPMLIGKYGYKMLEVIHRFLSTINVGDNRKLNNWTDPDILIDMYNRLYLKYMEEYTYGTVAEEVLRAMKSKAKLQEVEQLVNATPKLGVRKGTYLAMVLVDIFDDVEYVKPRDNKSKEDVLVETYNKLFAYYTQRQDRTNLVAKDIIRTFSSNAKVSDVEKIVDETPKGGAVKGTELADKIMNVFKDVEYKHSTIATPEDKNYDMSQNLIDQYSTRLYNWYANNPNFYSGDITVMGNPDFRLGNRLKYHDTESGVFMEFYIESVEHEFSYQDGYTTTLGVTRGLRISNANDDGDRFNPPSGPPQEFKGGYFGEISIGQMEAEAKRKEEEAEMRARVGLYEATGANFTSGISWPATGTITSHYGNRVHPITGEWKLHSGLDIGKDGSVHASSMAQGVVTTSRYAGGYGNMVMIDHGNLNGIGNVKTLYAHLQKSYVKVGKQVWTGQNIGVIGSTGVSTGPHLHFEVYVNDKRVDPNTFLKTHAGPKPTP